MCGEGGGMCRCVYVCVVRVRYSVCVEVSVCGCACIGVCVDGGGRGGHVCMWVYMFVCLRRYVYVCIIYYVTVRFPNFSSFSSVLINAVLFQFRIPMWLVDITG